MSDHSRSFRQTALEGDILFGISVFHIFSYTPCDCIAHYIKHYIDRAFLVEGTSAAPPPHGLRVQPAANWGSSSRFFLQPQDPHRFALAEGVWRGYTGYTEEREGGACQELPPTQQFFLVFLGWEFCWGIVIELLFPHLINEEGT